MKTMYIGSGDVTALLSGKHTETHAKLLRRFVSGEKPYYNAKASPIDAFRTGAILEDRYQLTLADNYFAQHLVVCEEMDVLKASLDFALIEKGKVINFDELKTCNFGDYLEFEDIKDDSNKCLAYIKKRYKNNYRQVQEQLLCTGLDSANIVFLAVYSYDDEVNYKRDIRENEYMKFRIHRDEKVISEIKERAEIFQKIKDYYSLTIK